MFIFKQLKTIVNDSFPFLTALGLQTEKFPSFMTEKAIGRLSSPCLGVDLIEKIK